MQRQGLRRNSAFMTLWTGESISLIGSSVTTLALPLTAIMLLHASPWQLGALIAVKSAASALASLFVGVLSDRVRRRPLLIIADIGQAVLLVAIPLALVLGQLRIEVLYVVAALVGAFAALFSTAYQAYLPSIVPADDLVAANGRLEGSRVFAQVIGPGLAGALIQVLRAPFALLVDAASFLVSALSIGLIRTVEVRQVRLAARSNLWCDIGQGLRHIFGQPLLRAELIVVVIFNFFAPMLNAQLALFAIRDLGLTPLLLGLGIIVASVCGVLASLVTGAISKRLGVGPTIVLATLLISLGWLIVPTLQRSWEFALPSLALGAAIGTTGDVLFNINSATLVQVLTPDHLRGRVGASMRVFILGGQPIGALVGGAIGVAFGVRVALLCAGCGFLLGCAAAFFSPIRALRQLPQAASVSSATPAESAPALSQ